MVKENVVEDMKIPSQNSRYPSVRLRVLAMLGVVALAAALTACEKPVAKLEDVRPVRTVVVQASNVTLDMELPGEVRPRIESGLGFRVGGKVVLRKVDVGAVVHRGDILMQIDPTDLRLAQAQANAAVLAAKSNLELANADWKRYKDLRDKNFVAQAVLDAKQTALDAARASYEQATAGMRVQTNQASYTTLVADEDGIVTGIDAEVGQVVGAGVPVVRVARTKEKEIVVNIPESKIDRLRSLTEIRVHTWANSGVAREGRIREVSPTADPVTRTYRARISIIDPGADVQLGMTAYVRMISTSASSYIKLPISAFQQVKEGSMVWVVDNGVANPHVVRVGDADGNDLVVLAGLSNGQTVVTAGVHSLKPGQKVKVLSDVVPSAAHDTIADAHLDIDPGSDSAATVGALGTMLANRSQPGQHPRGVQ